MMSVTDDCDEKSVGDQEFAAGSQGTHVSKIARPWGTPICYSAGIKCRCALSRVRCVPPAEPHWVPLTLMCRQRAAVKDDIDAPERSWDSLSNGIHPVIGAGVSGVAPVGWYIRIIDLAPRWWQSLQTKVLRGKVLIRHGLVVVISLICRVGHDWRGVISG